MAIGKVELMHKHFPKHSCMGTARNKYNKIQTKKVRRQEWIGKVVQWTPKKKSKHRNLAWACKPPGVATPLGACHTPQTNGWITYELHAANGWIRYCEGDFTNCCTAANGTIWYGEVDFANCFTAANG